METSQRKAPSIVRVPGNKSKDKPNGSAPYDSDRLHDDQAILEATKNLYSQLEDEEISARFLEYLRSLNKIAGNGDRYILNHPNFLDALFASFANAKSFSYDEERNAVFIEGRTQGRVKAKTEQIDFEPELRLKGKSKRLRKTPFNMNNAYEMAFAAMLDHDFLPPNKFEISNANAAEHAMIQIALRHIQRECLPKGVKFKIENPLSAVEIARIKFSYGIHDNFNQIMFRATERRKIEANPKNKETETPQAKTAGENPITQKPAEIRTTPGNAYESHYKGLTPDQALYNAAKNLLLTDPDKYLNGPLDILGADLAKLLSKDKMEAGDMNRILNHLKRDKLVDTTVANGATTITKITEVPPFHDKDYNRVAADIIHKPTDWAGKHRKDVAEKLFGKTTGLDKAETAKLKEVWDTLKRDTIINVDKKGNITSVFSALAGTEIGATFARAAEVPPHNPKRTRAPKASKDNDWKKIISSGTKGGIRLSGRFLKGSTALGATAFNGTVRGITNLAAMDKGPLGDVARGVKQRAAERAEDRKLSQQPDILGMPPFLGGGIIDLYGPAVD